MIVIKLIMPCVLCGQEGHNRRTCPMHYSTQQNLALRDEIWQNIRNMTPNPVISTSTPPTNPILLPASSLMFHNTNYNEQQHYIIQEIEQEPIPTELIPTEPISREHSWNGNLLSLFNQVADQHNTLDEPTNLVKLSDKIIETDSCPICFNTLAQTNKTITRCGHQFCGDCFIKHIKSSNSCPSCRGLLI